MQYQQVTLNPGHHVFKSEIVSGYSLGRYNWTNDPGQFRALEKHSP